VVDLKTSKKLAGRLGMYTLVGMVDENPKTPAVVINEIRAAILDGLYQPGERLLEADVAAKFKVSRSPVREALQALESEGTLVATPYTGAMVRPLSPAEIDEIAEIRLTLISLALKPAHRHLAPADFDLAYDLAKRITRTKSAREAFDVPASFGTSFLRKPSAQFLGKCFGNWTIAWRVIIRSCPDLSDSRD